MADLKRLNDGIRASKRTKKKATKVPAKPAPAPAIDFSPLVAAIEKIQQPVVNIQPREPVSYNVTVNLNSRGDMVGAKIQPIEK